MLVAQVFKPCLPTSGLGFIYKKKVLETSFEALG